MAVEILNSEVGYAPARNADRVISLMLMLVEQKRAARQAAGREEALDGLERKVLGIVGFDGTAKLLAEKVRMGFGMQVLVFAQGPADADFCQAVGYQQVSDLDELLARADFVSMHCRENAQDETLISAERMNGMKSDACIVNIQRPELVDVQALIHALWFETIGGAAFDRDSVPDGLMGAVKHCDNAVVWPSATGRRPVGYLDTVRHEMVA